MISAIRSGRNETMKKWDGFKVFQSEQDAKTFYRELGKRKKRIDEIWTIDDSGNPALMYEVKFDYII